MSGRMGRWISPRSAACRSSHHGDIGLVDLPFSNWPDSRRCIAREAKHQQARVSMLQPVGVRSLGCRRHLTNSRRDTVLVVRSLCPEPEHPRGFYRPRHRPPRRARSSVRRRGRISRPHRWRLVRRRIHSRRGPGEPIALRLRCTQRRLHHAANAPTAWAGLGMWTAAAAGLCLSASRRRRNRRRTSRSGFPLNRRRGGEGGSAAEPSRATHAAFDVHQGGRGLLRSPGARRGWVVFQAVPVPPRIQEPQPFYAMYVAKLKTTPGTFRASKSPSRSVRRVRPTPAAGSRTDQAFRVLFGSTLKAPRPAKDGYQRGTSRYVWQFPDEMEVVERCVSTMLSDLPKGHPLEGKSQTQRRRRSTGLASTELPQKATRTRSSQASDEFRRNSTLNVRRCGRARTGTKARPLFGCRSTTPSARTRRTVDSCSTRMKDLDSRSRTRTSSCSIPKRANTTRDRGGAGTTGPFFSPDNRSICYRSDRAERPAAVVRRGTQVRRRRAGGDRERKP